MAGLINGILTPSDPDEDDYTFAVIGYAHMGLGAVLHQLTGWVVVAAFGYWFVKERYDRRAGGTWVDSAFDTWFVAAGAALTAVGASHVSYWAVVFFTLLLRWWLRKFFIMT